MYEFISGGAMCEVPPKVVERDELWECSMKRLNTLAWKHMVSIPKEPTRGLYFGQCTCGLITCDAVPCEHMAVVVCSSRIARLNRRNIMPFWWTRKQWQEQFPQEVTLQCYANMEVIRADYDADDFMCYCPSWSAPNKAGPPVEGQTQAVCSRNITGGKEKVEAIDEILSTL